MAPKNVPKAKGMEHASVTPKRQTQPAVALVSSGRSGLLEVGGQLARDGVGMSRAISVRDGDLGRKSEGRGMIAALRALQADPATEVIALVGAAAEPAVTRAVLDQVRDSDKPTVVCLLGIERKLVWRAGAIPASRLDEAAMRAAAWVLDRDQALISTRLEELDEHLKAQARELRPMIGPGRHKVLGLLSSRLFDLEAQLMLTEVAGSQADAPFQNLRRLTDSESPRTEAAAAQQRTALRETLRRPDVAIVLADVGFGGLCLPNLEVALHSERLKDSVLVAHASTEASLGQSMEPRDRLEAAGVIVAPSNATAARLAAFCMSG